MRTLLRWLIIIVLIITTGIIGKSIFNQSSKFQEIYRAEDEAKELATENKKLKKVLEEQKSPLSLERGARDKLGFQKPGDILFVVPRDKGVLVGNGSKNDKKNWEEWFKLFFR